MVQASQGYLRDDGRFILQNPMLVKPPVNRLLTVVWEEEENTAMKQNKALRQFRASIKEINDEPIDDEFRAIVNDGTTIDSGVNL